MAELGVLSLLPPECMEKAQIDSAMVECNVQDVQDLCSKSDRVLELRRELALVGGGAVPRWLPARLEDAEVQRLEHRSQFILRHAKMPHYPERDQLLQLLHEDDQRLSPNLPWLAFEFDYALTRLEADARQVGLARERLLRKRAENPLLNPHPRGHPSHFAFQERDLSSRHSLYKFWRQQVVKRLDVLPLPARVRGLRRVEAANRAAARLSELE
jgi:hypothetical protein